MNGTDPFPTGEWVDQSGKNFSSQQLEDHVTLIVRIVCDDASAGSNTLTSFYDQFKDTQKANFIILDSCADSADLSDPLKMKWYVFSCPDSAGLCAMLSSSWPSGRTHALVDRHQIIRSYYASETEDEKRILLEHMALLLPRDRSEKVELKRGNR